MECCNQIKLIILWCMIGISSIHSSVVLFFVLFSLNGYAQSDSSIIVEILDSSSIAFESLSAIAGFDDNGRATALSIKNKGLKVLPASIGNLELLRYLDLRGNGLDSLPSEICNLGSLQEIRLENNVLTVLPECITGFPADYVVYVDNVAYIYPTMYITGNKLCDVSPALDEWLGSLNPNWQDSQECGLDVQIFSKKRTDMQMTINTGAYTRVNFGIDGRRIGKRACSYFEIERHFNEE